MRLGFAFFLVFIAATLVRCVSASPSPSPAPQASAQESAAPEEVQNKIVQLEDGTYVELKPGLERGFTHCCGNDNYMLEIDCSDGLMRCYEHPDARWKQTYGRHCKKALSQSCYEHSCDNVCEAFRVFEGQLE